MFESGIPKNEDKHLELEDNRYALITSDLKHIDYEGFYDECQYLRDMVSFILFIGRVDPEKLKAIAEVAASVNNSIMERFQGSLTPENFLCDMFSGEKRMISGWKNIMIVGDGSDHPLYTNNSIPLIDLVAGVYYLRFITDEVPNPLGVIRDSFNDRTPEELEEVIEVYRAVNIPLVKHRKGDSDKQYAEFDPEEIWRNLAEVSKELVKNGNQCFIIGDEKTHTFPLFKTMMESLCLQEEISDLPMPLIHSVGSLNLLEVPSEALIQRRYTDELTMSSLFLRALILEYTGGYIDLGVAFHDSLVTERYGSCGSAIRDYLKDEDKLADVSDEMKTIVSITRYIKLVILTSTFARHFGLDVPIEDLEFGSVSALALAVTDKLLDRFLSAQEGFKQRYDFYFMPCRSYIGRYSRDVLGIESAEYDALNVFAEEFAALINGLRLSLVPFPFRCSESHSFYFPGLLYRLEEAVAEKGDSFQNLVEAFDTREELAEFLRRRLIDWEIELLDQIPSISDPSFSDIFLFSAYWLDEIKTKFGTKWYRILFEAARRVCSDLWDSWDFYYEGVECKRDLVEKILPLVERRDIGSLEKFRKCLLPFPRVNSGIRLVSPRGRGFKEYLEGLNTTMLELKEAVIEARSRNQDTEQ